MKFKLSQEPDATVYDADLGLAKVSLALLFELKVKHGISAKDLSEMANYLNKFNGKSPIELMDDKVALRALMVVIWLTRRYYDKEKLSLDEANSFAMDEFFIVPEDDDDPKEAPEPATVSAPVAEGEVPNIPTT
jgi:hypothetical protein